MPGGVALTSVRAGPGGACVIVTSTVAVASSPGSSGLDTASTTWPVRCGRIVYSIVAACNSVPSATTSPLPS